jgi:hypothetical protein
MSTVPVAVSRLALCTSVALNGCLLQKEDPLVFVLKACLPARRASEVTNTRSTTCSLGNASAIPRAGRVA